MRYRACRVPSSCFALLESFHVVPRASGPIFMFCAPGLVSAVPRDVSEQWEVMQDIKTQHNEIMIMIETLQTTIYNFRLLKEEASEPRSGTPERQTPDSDKQVIVIVNEAKTEEATFKQSATVPTWP
jgi:hypothetical protein